MTKIAKPDYPIHELISERWSPYGFSEKQVSKEDLYSLFEAARWAASSYNEQPWSFIVAMKDQAAEFEKLLSCLVEANQAWAKQASALVLCCTNLHFERNGKENTAAIHDLGLAAGNLSLEATSRGISLHQMIGIQPDKAQELFKIPERILPLTAIAIGYLADPDSHSKELQARDQSPRSRKPLSEFVFRSKWGENCFEEIS